MENPSVFSKPPSGLSVPAVPPSRGEDSEPCSPLGQRTYAPTLSFTSTALLDGQFSSTLDDNMPFPSTVMTADENRKLKKEIEELTCRESQKNSRILGLQARCNELEYRLKKQQPTSSASVTESETKAPQQESEMLKTEMDRLKERLQVTECERDIWQVACHKAEKLLETTSTEKANLGEVHSALQEEREKLLEANAVLTEENRKLVEEASSRSAAEETKQQLEALSRSNDETKLQLEHLKEERDQLAKSKAKLERENINLKRQKNETSFESIQLGRELANVKALLRKAKEETGQLFETNAVQLAELGRLKNAIDQRKIPEWDEDQRPELLSVVDHQRRRIEVLEAALQDEGYELNA